MRGNPQKIIEDETLVGKIRDEDSNLSADRWSSVNPNIFNEFYSKKKKYCYEYDDKGSEIEKWHIYLYKDEVVWMLLPWLLEETKPD